MMGEEGEGWGWWRGRGHQGKQSKNAQPSQLATLDHLVCTLCCSVLWQLLSGPSLSLCCGSCSLQSLPSSVSKQMTAFASVWGQSQAYPDLHCDTTARPSTAESTTWSSVCDGVGKPGPLAVAAGVWTAMVHWGGKLLLQQVHQVNLAVELLDC